jgi:hypothetical protein
MPSLRRRLLLLATLAPLALVACGGGGVKQRVFAPTLSVQELRLSDDGSWAVSFRLQNFSNVSMRMDTVEARFELGGHEAGKVSLAPRLDVPANSAELLKADVSPSPAAAAALQQALASGGSVRYRLEGRIRSSAPRSRDDGFEFSSLLSPAPGLPGVLR